jgi:hypothetical protein
LFGFGGRPGPRGGGWVAGWGKRDGEDFKTSEAVVKNGFTGLEVVIGLLKLADVGFMALRGMRGGSMDAWMGSQYDFENGSMDLMLGSDWSVNITQGERKLTKYHLHPIRQHLHIRIPLFPILPT